MNTNTDENIEDVDETACNALADGNWGCAASCDMLNFSADFMDQIGGVLGTPCGDINAEGIGACCSTPPPSCLCVGKSVDNKDAHIVVCENRVEGIVWESNTRAKCATHNTAEITQCRTIFSGDGSYDDAKCEKEFGSRWKTITATCSLWAKLYTKGAEVCTRETAKTIEDQCCIARVTPGKTTSKSSSALQLGYMHMNLHAQQNIVYCMTNKLNRSRIILCRNS